MQGATHFATGGIVTQPTRALVGEKGPEAVVPLTRGIDQINSLKSLQDYLVTQQPKGKGAIATGDASRAWQNIKDSFTKPWTSMWSDVSSLYNTIKTTGRLPQPEPTYLGTGKPTPLHGMIDMPRKAAPSTHVNFSPVVTINGNASEAEQQALDGRLRALARDFVADFKRAQTHERRLSYEGGYG
jgi:hypothetical protein